MSNPLNIHLLNKAQEINRHIQIEESKLGRLTLEDEITWHKCNADIKANEAKYKSYLSYYLELSNVSDSPLVISVSDLLKLPKSNCSWLVYNLVPLSGITAITGVPGSYKSWLSLEIARAVSSGDLFLDNFICEQRNVLIIDLENPISTRQERIHLLGINNDNPIYFWQNDFLITKEIDLLSLRKQIKDKNIGLVIFDSLVRIHINDENDSRSMAEVFKKIRSMTSLGVSIIFIHHNRKTNPNFKGNLSETMRGSSDIWAAIDSHLLLTKDNDNVVLTQPKLRQDKPVNPIKIKVESTKDNFRFICEGDLANNDFSEKISGEVLDIVKESAQPVYRKIVHEKLNSIYSTKHIDDTLIKLLGSGLIKKGVGSHNKHTYSLVEK